MTSEVPHKVVSPYVVPIPRLQEREPRVCRSRSPVSDYVVIAVQIHLHRDRHEIRSSRILDPVSQMQPAIKCLLTSPDIRIAKVPSELLHFVDNTVAVTQICLLRASEMLSQAFFA